ncbi:YeeE/YedE thiosulfate transporter family protein [Mycolicibacterium sp. J2]|uniref:YeeE/YedE thiosulfate transporter family protein n=1 Tax=Mycolicibacterium sp. J2 TaxID=2993511 RepID=UPI00224AC952|nr:YeeE/YedE thiosulfate transporter family protein [Mycolicibacterium sp. J2]MCX2713355.1 YeeE/YedE thiosulfate transporter family protein [Mycolicibacterium sp. J2]
MSSSHRRIRLRRMSGVTAPLWVALPIGIAFGMVAGLWGIGNPEMIIRTARLVDRLLLGCFLFVTAVGAVLLYGLYAVGVPMHLAPKPLYVVGVMTGGVLFGTGAAISGYFPGTALIALGEGRRDALAAIPGGLLGAAAWTAVYGTPVGHWLTTTANHGGLVAGEPLGAQTPGRLLLIAVGYAALAFVLLNYLPRFRGGERCCLRTLRGASPTEFDRLMTRDTIGYLYEGADDGHRRRWFKRVSGDRVAHPAFFSRTTAAVAAGVAVLVVLSIFLRQPFGQSTTYSWVVGELFMPDFAYSRQVIAGIGWEPLSDLGVLVGAFISARFISGRFTRFRPVVPPSWRHRFGARRGNRAAAVFAGSFLTLFGARMAGGCTSGHTLSGGIQLSVSSWLFTVAMLAAMVVTARLVYRDAPWSVTVAGHHDPAARTSGS